MVIYGREGTLMATGNVSSQRGEMLRVQGRSVPRAERHADLPIALSGCRRSSPRRSFNVGQMYRLFAEAIRTGQTQSRLPTSTPRSTCIASSDYDQAVIGYGTGAASA